ncbi:MAG: transposase family protein, partial [Acidimicrobiaceae bacterium]|nr:transposase family protein [Acidimicrobiaceae bacterium]
MARDSVVARLVEQLVCVAPSLLSLRGNVGRGVVEGLRCGVEALLGSVIDMITIRGAPMACDVVRVRLHLRRVRVLGVLADAPDVLRVGVESASRRLRCPHCGFKCHRVHDTRDKQVRDLEVSGRRTTLVWVRRRFRRDNCGSRFLEEHPGFGGGLTRRLAQRLVADAQVMTIRAATRRHGVSRPVIDALVRACSGLVAEHRRSRRCRVL